MFWTSRGAKFYFTVQGQGQPLLCLPPFPCDHAFYARQSPLAGAARLVGVDYPGTGRSADAGPITLELLAQDLLALLDALEAERAVVLGVSLGGYAALALYALAPERVAGLILADTRSEADMPEQVRQRAQTADRLLTEGPGVLTERVSQLFGASTRQEHPDWVATLQDQVSRERGKGLAELTLAMGRRPDRTPLLSAIRCPVLVVCGAEDTVSPPAGMERMAAAIPGAAFHVIPRAGHLSPLEQPEAFNRLAGAFLRSVEAGHDT